MNDIENPEDRYSENKTWKEIQLTTDMCDSQHYRNWIKSLIIKHGNTLATLNLGCGGNKFCGVNVDFNEKVNPDIIMDLNQFPYDLPDNNFDTIIMLNVLEHMLYPEKTIDECCRILNDGGRLIVAVPTPKSKFYEHDAHVQHFTKKTLKELFCIFDKVKIIGYRGTSHENIPSWFGRLLGLFIANEWVCVCDK